MTGANVLSDRADTEHCVRRRQLPQSQCPAPDKNLHCTDFLALLGGSKAKLVAELAQGQGGWPAARAGTVGARFREQLRDLIGRLDRCDAVLVEGD